MENDDTFKTLKDIVAELSDDKNKDIIKKAMGKIGKGEKLDDDEKKCIHELTDDARYVKKISNNAIEFSNELQKRTSLGFLIVLGMYVVAFAVGIVLIAYSMYYASNTKDPNEYLAAFFGAIGVADLMILLYKPAQKIQESRANASQLLAAFMEWQFVSIWSGKLFGKLYKEFDACDNKKDLFEKMKTILNLKVTLTNNLVKTMNDSTKEEPEEKQEAKPQDNSVKYLENDKKNLAKATGIPEGKLDYTDLKVIKQQKEFVLGIDKNKGKGSTEQFWTAKKIDKEFKKEPTEDEIKKEFESIEGFVEPKHKCSEGTSWDGGKEWKQWSLLNHQKEEKWILRFYNNKQWKCGKKNP